MAFSEKVAIAVHMISGNTNLKTNLRLVLNTEKIT